MQKRNYSLDLLRMAAMFLVTTLHTLGHGGLLEATIPYSGNYYLAWAIEAMALCAVNCYGILSGYVGVNGTYRYTNFIQLWLQVILYSVGFTLLLGCLGKIELTSEVIKTACFPIMNGQYWYFTAYAGVFFITPVLNLALNNMTQKQLRTLLLGCILVFCLLPTYFQVDPFKLGGGYSFVWLTLLYIIGGCFQKGRLFEYSKCLIWFLCYFICGFCAWLFKYLVEKHTIATQIGVINPNLLMSYTSPTILFAAIALFFMFRQMQLPEFATKIIKMFSPSAFGVYLIHDNRKIRNLFVSGISADLATVEKIDLIFSVFVIVLKIYIICLCIDLIRYHLFKALKIREHLIKVEKKLLGDLWQD